MKRTDILLVPVLLITFCIGQNRLYANNNPDSKNNVPEVKTSTSSEQNQASTPNEKTGNILFQSADGGKTWQDLSGGLPQNLKVSFVSAWEGELYLGTQNGILYHSRNPKSGPWEKEQIGGGVHRESIDGIYPGRSGLYVSIYEGGFYRKTKGTKNWKPMHETLSEKSIHTVLENQDGSIFVSSRNGIFKSDDDGKTWKHIFTDGWIGSMRSDGNVIIASGAQGLLRSTDGGGHWACVLNDQDGNSQMSVIEDRFVALRLAGPIHTIPWNISGDTLPQRAYTSIDEGKTWQRIDQSLSADRRIYDLEKAGEYFFCSHKTGISRSADGGKNWKTLSMPDATSDTLHFELVVSGQMVYAVNIPLSGC